MILAGGRGSRLADLTRWRVKPAVPFGGKYRIIDFTLSNCINSDLRKIAVLTQYKSQSLIRHIYHGWNVFNSEFGEFIEVVPAQQRNRNDWFRGTADAVFQNMDFIVRNNPQWVLVLGGDHVYSMDYNYILQFHRERNADVTIASVPVTLKEGSACGVLEIDDSGHVERFVEKPEKPVPIPDQPDYCLASMGIYVFNTQFLTRKLIENDKKPGTAHDFGRDILPASVTNPSDRVFSWTFWNEEQNRPGYWRDVGTVDSYWKANMDLVSVSPEFNLYDRSWPIRSCLAQFPPAKFVFNDSNRRGMAVDSLVSEGSIISGSLVERSLISTNVYIMDARINDSVILPDVVINNNARIRNAIIDKYCVIPEGIVIGESVEEDGKWFHITDGGIVLVTPEMLNTREKYRRTSDSQYLAMRLNISGGS